MIKEGLKHSQKVYKGVYEFTNLVKKDVVLNKAECNLKDILNDYLSNKFRNIIKPSVSKDYSNSEIDVPISDISDDSCANFSL